MSLLDAVLPAPDHATRRAVTVRAPAKVVFAAVESVSAGDLPVMRILMGVRMLPATAAEARCSSSSSHVADRGHVRERLRHPGAR